MVAIKKEDKVPGVWCSYQGSQTSSYSRYQRHPFKQMLYFNKHTLEREALEVEGRPIVVSCVSVMPCMLPFVCTLYV